MKTLKVTNKINAPYGVRTTKGVRVLAPGETVQAEFEDGEAANIIANTAVFAVDGHGDAHAASADTVNRDRAQLAALAAMFGDPNVNADNVHEAVKELLDVAPWEDRNGFSDPSMAEAVAKLDDGEPDHWTQAGKPAIAAVEAIYGKPVTRDEVDAVGRVRKI